MTSSCPCMAGAAHGLGGCPRPPVVVSASAIRRSGSRAGGRRLLVTQRERDLVVVAPQPTLARLERADNRMARSEMMRGRVAVRAVVAAADVTALGASPEVHPSATDGHAVRAHGSIGAVFKVVDRVEVGADRVVAHGPSPFAWADLLLGT